MYTSDTEEEALAIANNTEYGLSSAIFTQDLAAELRVAKQNVIDAFYVNSMSIHDEALVPHGRTRKSVFRTFMQVKD